MSISDLPCLTILLWRLPKKLGYTEMLDCFAEAKLVKYIETIKEVLEKCVETDGLGTGISKIKKLATAEAFFVEKAKSFGWTFLFVSIFLFSSFIFCLTF